jgi:hypothetical protein
MKKKTIFSSDEAKIELGVGKNRVNAIKYEFYIKESYPDFSTVYN